MAAEPIVRCPSCGGEGILPGPRVCMSCHGEGLQVSHRYRSAVDRMRLETADTEPPPAPEDVHCSCGASYDAEAFGALPFVGYQDDFEGGWLELRNCTASTNGRTCRSTIARRATSKGA